MSEAITDKIKKILAMGMSNNELIGALEVLFEKEFLNRCDECEDVMPDEPMRDESRD